MRLPEPSAVRSPREPTSRASQSLYRLRVVIIIIIIILTFNIIIARVSILIVSIIY